MLCRIRMLADNRLIDFSLPEGGPLYRLGRSLGLPHDARGLIYLGLGVAVLTWLPLFILSAVDRVVTSGPTIPFLESLGTHVRLLVTIPLFFLTQALFGRRARQAIGALVESRVIPDSQLPRLNAVLSRAMRVRDSWLLETALLAMTFILIGLGLRTDLPDEVSTWRAQTSGLTLAGHWYSVVSLPVFQFLIWRWCAHLLIWGAVLWTISRLDLQLVPTHPDLAGGLGPLGVAHTSLAMLNFGTSAMLTASYAESILYGGARLDRLVLPLSSAVVGSTLLAVLPLFLFMPRLIAVKQQGILEYSPLAARYVREFDEKWVRSQPKSDEPLLGTADVQSLADLSNAFGVIRNMRVVPISGSQVLLIAAATALPTAPLVLFVVPLNELIIRSVRTILHV